MSKPEFGSLVGVIVVFIFFAVKSEPFRSTNGAATWLDQASLLGVMAVPVALLMIGGHFDLSAGVQTGTSGLGHRHHDHLLGTERRARPWSCR